MIELSTALLVHSQTALPDITIMWDVPILA